MLFALDRGAASTFADVPEDSPYYACLASGQSAGLVKDVSETEFGGEQELTVKQMLPLTGRTLREQRGYPPPEYPESCLNSFTDGGDAADWASLHTALLVIKTMEH